MLSFQSSKGKLLMEKRTECTSSLYGILAAVSTPFKNQKIDEKSFVRHLEFLLENGITGVVPCGTTGEFIALSLEERGRLIELCLQTCRGQAFVVPGTGAPTTQEALVYTRQAQDLGADAALVITPFYVKADPEGVRTYYQTIHNETRIPLLLYSNPGRTGIELGVDLIGDLSHNCPRIIGLKDASSDLARPLLLSTRTPSSFRLFSGEDVTFGAFLAQGGWGLISVTANVIPHLYTQMHLAWQTGDFKTFLEIQRRTFPLARLLFEAPSPGPLKWVLSLLGYGETDSRLPLGPLSTSHKEALQKSLEDLGILP